jgi:hypothetical protein
VPTKDEWRSVFRPQKTTDSNCLVHVTVQAGDAVLLHSPRFEIRTKPSAWMMLRNLPPHYSI